ncbi:amidohydrolase family protein [Sphingomonas sp. PAMC 26621]|uniref:amidohydrolase family protein n=1 Tax=Sphingomonas sp. PAMC 26621 TaxID=1112213 RepID=UPI000289AC1D|nr:amidohydrolase family protein [Sphingomonas sp. PAMC 26621]
MPLIDAHQHFWSLATPGHIWPTAAEGAIHRDFGPDDLRNASAGVTLDGTVLVQSQPTDRDTDWMLALAARTPLVRAVVGWVDLLQPDAPVRIAALARHPKLRGLRPMLQAIPDPDWLLQDALTPALEAMRVEGLRLDALVQPRHLPMLARFAARWPDLPIVIDHAAKPDAARMTLDPWRGDIAALGGLGLSCKLSGLRTEQAPGQPAEALMPYVAHLVETFGARLMWGSDWPVVRLSGDDWRRWHDDARHLAARAGADLDQLFGGAAIAFYGL